MVHPNDKIFIIYAPWYQYFWYTGKCQNKIKGRCIDFLKIPSNVKIKQMISRQQRKWINTKWRYLCKESVLAHYYLKCLYIIVGRISYCNLSDFFFIVLKINHIYRTIDRREILIIWCHCLHQSDVRHKIIQSYCKNWMCRKNDFMIPLGSRILSQPWTEKDSTSF